MFSFRTVLITACSLFSLNTWAADLYVSTSGSDSNSGTSSAPFRTIQRAADKATAGTTVHVAPGTYAETINSTVSGTASGRIRYVSDTKWGAKIVPVAGANVVWRVDGGYTDIDGFQIDGTGNTSARSGIYLDGGNSSVRNSWVHHFAQNTGCDSNGGAAIVSDQSRGTAFNNYDFTGNLVHDIGDSCGYIQGIYHSSTGTIKNNVVFATAQGINMGHDAHNIDVVNNTLFGNSGYGVWFGGCAEAYLGNNCPMSGINIHNNIIYDNYGGIQGPGTAEDTGSNSLRNNLVYGNSIDFDLSSHSVGQTSGTISADPQFLNYVRTGGGNYHLKSTSPAIDKGTATYAPSMDYDGNPRPQGAGFDLGAYEYGSVPVPAPVPAPAPPPPPAGMPVVSLSTSSLMFGSQLLGTTSAVQFVTITNTGMADLIFGSDSISGDFAFGELSTCASSLTVGAGCTFSAKFTPTALGTRTGALIINTNASSTPVSVALSGSGISSPTIDSTAPLTAITAPASSSSVAIRTYVTIQAKASDNVAVKTVEFYVNGNLKCTTSASATLYQCVWRVPRQPGKTYSLQTKAYDTAGNMGVSSQVMLTSK